MINKSHNVEKRVEHRNVGTKEPSNDCGDDHLVDHRSTPLPVGPQLFCVLLRTSQGNPDAKREPWHESTNV